MYGWLQWPIGPIEDVKQWVSHYENCLNGRICYWQRSYIDMWWGQWTRMWFYVGVQRKRDYNCSRALAESQDWCRF